MNAVIDSNSANALPAIDLCEIYSIVLVCNIYH